MEKFFKTAMKLILLIILATIYPATVMVNAQTGSQAGLEFFVGGLKNYKGLPSEYQLYLTTLSTTDVSYTVEQKSGIITTGTISVNNPAIEILDSDLISLDSSYIHRNKGIRVHSNGPVSLLVVNYRQHTIGDYTAFPYQVLQSSKYRYYAVSIRTSILHTMSEILLVGNGDNTTITITPTASILVPIDIHSASSPMETLLTGSTKVIKLNRFQTFLFGASNSVDLSGTAITSNKPLTVISGHECGNIPFDIGACEHVTEHIPPVATWGKSFLLAPYAGKTSGQFFKLIASETSTTIMHNCNSEVSTLHLAFAGNSKNFSTTNTTFCYLESDKPLLVTQLTPGAGLDNNQLGDPAITLLPPIEQYKREIDFYTPDIVDNDKHYINIVATKQSTMLLDDSVLSLLWNPINNINNEIVGYAAHVTNISIGAHTVTSMDNITLSILVYGFGRAEAYSYTAGRTGFTLCKVDNGGCCVNTGDCVCTIDEATCDALISITPHYGNQLGGTPVLIKGISFNGLVNITCQFGDIKTRGIRISNREAMCVSPRLAKSGSVPFSVSINDVLVENSVRFFYAQHYSDLADVTVDPRNLIISSGQWLNINWLTSSLLPTADSDINVDIILHEAAVSFSKTITWIGEYMVESNLSNDGSASIRIPPIVSSSTFNEFNSSYSLIVIQIAVSTSSASNNQYWKALKELQTTDTRFTVGRWTHVLFRRHVRLNRLQRAQSDSDNVLCSNWLSSDRSHFSLDFTNDLDPCPCNRLQAQLPQSGFTQRITPGKKIIDQFLFGSTTTCYESRNLIDPGDGRHIISQECCYNRQGNLLVGGPYGGSANAQPSSAWENHFVFDLSPFISCCLIRSRYSEYYEKRPSDNCSRFQPFNIGWLRGDPHLLTLDGHQYTFNGRGEFILIETLNNRFTLQGRMIPAENDGGTESLGTVFSAIVAKQNDSDVIELRRSVTGILTFVNNMEIELEVSLPEAYNNVTITNEGNDTYSALFSSGVFLEVKQRNGFLSGIAVSLPRTFFALTQGLMGVYNNDPSDDLLPRNSSTPLPLNSSIEKVHYDFGVTWIVNDSSQSLFSYDSSNDFFSFYDPIFTPTFNPQFNNSELEEQAKQVCQGDTECLFDIAATGRMEIGMATLEQQVIIENAKEIVKPIICNPSCINGVCVANDTCSCMFGYTGDLCDMKDSCAYNANPSPCEDQIVGWFFNSDTEQCQFGGCEGRGNMFTSMADCVKVCGCPGGATPNRQCLLNPCSFSTCRAFPNAQCEVDACDSCISRYTVGLTEVTSMCDPPCEPDTEQFNCLVDPCDNAYCPNFPDANCLPDYCGGCSARFYDIFGVEVTDKCSICPDDKPELNCPFNLCDHQKCLNIPDADCVFDVCGGCTARFYLGNEEVTDQCMFCRGSGQIFTSSGGTCQERTCENSGQVLCSVVSIPGCDCPVGMVLNTLNNTCVIPEDCPCPDCDPLPDNCSVIIPPSPDEQCGCDTCAECPLGEVFHECRSCPRTCAEQIDQSLCTTACKRGCGCPNGELLDEEANRCVSVDECPKLDICTLPAEKGICSGDLGRYFYNSVTKSCELFRYGGCFGNENNFFTLHDCEMACSAFPPTCTPTFCVKERRATCYLPNADQNNCSKDYSVSNCQVCHYSSDLQSFSCDLDCIDVNGEYDDTCLRNWGVCLRQSYLHIFRSVPSNERVPENYKCIEYRCD